MLLIKLEIILFILSLGYMIYYFYDKIIIAYKKVNEGTRANVSNVQGEQKVTKIVNLESEDKLDLLDYKNLKLTESQKEKLNDIIKRVKMNSEKGYFDTSKQLIIEGLALDKYNKELNLQLAYIYEKENNYNKAEYVYLELNKVFKNDAEIMKKLAFVYAMENKLEDSFSTYEKVFKKKSADFEVIRMLADLAYDMKKYKKSLKYTMLVLKEKPRDVDKLLMKAVCLEKTHLPAEALDAYNRILQLQPYNTVARDQIRKLTQTV